MKDGEYTIMVYATDSSEGKGISDSFPYMDTVDIKSQVFYAKKEFVVNKDNQDLKESIILSRLFGKLEIVIEDIDDLPEEVQSITPFVSAHARISKIPDMPSRPYQFNLIHQTICWGRGSDFSLYLGISFQQKQR